MRDVEAVIPAKREEEVVAGYARDLLRLEPEKTPDAVILVDDVVPGTQVGEGLQRPAESRIRTRRPLAEDLDVREQRNPQIPPHEPAAGRADDEAQCRIARKRRALVVDGGVDPSE